MILFCHPSGNANARAVLEALEGGGILGAFFTALAVNPDSGWLNMLPARIGRELCRRVFSVPAEKIYQSPFREIGRQICHRSGWEFPIRPERGIFCVDQVWREVGKRAAEWLAGKDKISGVYAYEDAALDLFRVAKERSVRCFYDLPIGYFEAARRIFSEERERMPLFADSLEGLNDSEEKMNRKRQEAEHADVILAASDFVRETLEESGIPKSKIRVLQFGAPEYIPQAEEDRRAGSKRLRVLFVGRLDQRKGIGYLLEAVKKLNSPLIELIMLGMVSGNPRWMLDYQGWYRLEKTRPQAEVWRLMQKCDCLVLPSLFEGQALVVLEAMRCGLPVIVTRNTGTAPLVREGRDGFVVPIRSADAIAEKIEWMAVHAKECREMGVSAQKRVQEITWARYRHQVLNVIEEGLRL